MYSEEAQTSWHLFNITLSTTIIPACFKAFTIIPVPKKSSVSCLSDYHPVTRKQITAAPFTGLPAICISSQLLNELYHHHYPSPGSQPPGQKRRLDENVIHRLQSSIQHHLSSVSDWKAKTPGPEHLSVTGSWTSWLGDLSESGSGSTSLVPPLWAQASLVHAAEPRLCSHAQLKLHHQVCWWHESGGVQRGSAMANALVQRQLVSECGQYKRVNFRRAGCDNSPLIINSYLAGAPAPSSKRPTLVSVSCLDFREHSL